MRVSNITCHDVYNYGASLQAYALQEYCTKIGCDYEIINYKPDYLSNHFKLWAICNSQYDKPILKQLYLFLKLPGRLLSLRRKRRFDSFTDCFLKLSKKRYVSNDDIKNNLPAADLFIAGSDQIWNTILKNGHDKAFYLNFAPKEKRKISYAASFATDIIHNDAEEFVARELHNFNTISVRETSGLTLLKSLGIENAIVVCDPVFLLSADEWEKLLISRSASVDTPAKYILVYDCEKSQKLREIAIELKQRTNLPIVRVSNTAGNYHDKDWRNAGPLEFLQLVHGADYVVANSFHALAFSIIFKKEFFIVNRSESINTRMRDFLELIGEPNRLLTNRLPDNSTTINYNNINKRIYPLIKDSKCYLSQQIAIE